VLKQTPRPGAIRARGTKVSLVVGRRYHGGVWYGTGGRRFWRGQWYPYGVGPCWLLTPIGYVWVC